MGKLRRVCRRIESLGKGMFREGAHERSVVDVRITTWHPMWEVCKRCPGIGEFRAVGCNYFR